MFTLIASGWAALTGNPVARKVATIVGAVFLLFIGYHIWKGQVEAGGAINRSASACSPHRRR